MSRVVRSRRRSGTPGPPHCTHTVLGNNLRLIGYNEVFGSFGSVGQMPVLGHRPDLVSCTVQVPSNNLRPVGYYSEVFGSFGPVSQMLGHATALYQC